MKSKYPNYMMATVANHKSGDISRKCPDLCIVYSEDNDNYIGNWITGFGFIDVKFPKNSTRQLTPEEIEHYHGHIFEMSGSAMVLNLKKEDFKRPIYLTKKETGETKLGNLMAPLKEGSCIYFIDLNSAGTLLTSRIESIKGNVVKTQNSTYVIEYI